MLLQLLLLLAARLTQLQRRLLNLPRSLAAGWLGIYNARLDSSRRQLRGSPRLACWSVLCGLKEALLPVTRSGWPRLLLLE